MTPSAAPEAALGQQEWAPLRLVWVGGLPRLLDEPTGQCLAAGLPTPVHDHSHRYGHGLGHSQSQEGQGRGRGRGIHNLGTGTDMGIGIDDLVRLQLPERAEAANAAAGMLGDA